MKDIHQNNQFGSWDLAMYPRMTLSPKRGVVGINTPWHFRYLQQVQMPFYTQTFRDWNELPDSLISSAELSDDCVSKFTSLVRARD